jgi:hypothetical protein
MVHKQGWFEVIPGKSVVAFWREEEDEVPSAKCFGYVRLSSPERLRVLNAARIAVGDLVPTYLISCN